jgi:type IV pilus assembly protein PilB
MSREVLKINKTDIFGKVLLDLNLITPEKLEIALKEQSSLDKKNHRRLGEILINLGFISEDEMLRGLSAQLNLQHLKFSEFPKSIPEGPYPTVKFMKQYKFVPIGVEDGDAV